jgi:predicted nucleotide-binding protein (sugar kinase/HSP70/actin superfamily)
VALDKQNNYRTGIFNENFRLKVALAGHPYNVYDKFINMNIVQKLNKLGVGAITEENVNDDVIDDEVKKRGLKYSHNRTRIVFSHLGDSAPIKGAASCVIKDLFEYPKKFL